MDVVKKIEVNPSNISYIFEGLELVKNSKIHFEVLFPNEQRWCVAGYQQPLSIQ